MSFFLHEEKNYQNYKIFSFCELLKLEPKLDFKYILLGSTVIILDGITQSPLRMCEGNQAFSEN